MALLYGEEERLRRERRETWLLRDEEPRLRESSLFSGGGRDYIVKAPKALSDFGEALTKAETSNKVLRLAPGTYFFGKPSLGSVLFIRPCYVDLWKIISDHVAADEFRNMVVTGTPGVGKSVFAFYIMYHLRCKGKAVVFNQEDWYRFSDSGVEKGTFYSFMFAGYFADREYWFLRGPVNRPDESLFGPTVVFVSPKGHPPYEYRRTHEFMKAPKTIQFFLPIWTEKELLRCQELVVTWVTRAEVKAAFKRVGGVARAVFDPRKGAELFRRMRAKAKTADVASLERRCNLRYPTQHAFPADDTVLHMDILPEIGYKEFTLIFASEDAQDILSA